MQRWLHGHRWQEGVTTPAGMSTLGEEPHIPHTCKFPWVGIGREDSLRVAHGEPEKTP